MKLCLLFFTNSSELQLTLEQQEVRGADLPHFPIPPPRTDENLHVTSDSPKT